MNMKAGEAEVTRAAFAAVESLVPTNWKLREMPYPIHPTHSASRRRGHAKPLSFWRNSKIARRHNAPRRSRKLRSVRGGMTSNTTLLTTYIPPHIEAAANPARSPHVDIWNLTGSFALYDLGARGFNQA